jgi:hypothetical protein
MRSEKPIMTSRGEFLSNALGIPLVMASSWPSRADYAHLMHGRSDTSPSNSERTTQNTSLRWTYSKEKLLAPGAFELCSAVRGSRNSRTVIPQAPGSSSGRESLLPLAALCLRMLLRL